MAVADVFAVLGSIAAGYLFLSPVSTMRSIRRRGSAAHFSPLPYLAQLCESAVWATYAATMLEARVPILANNLAGCGCSIVYLGFFLRYGPAADAELSYQRVLALCLLAAGFVGGVVAYAASRGFSCEILGDREAVGVCYDLGLVAVALNIGKYASPLGVMSRVVRTKSVEFMPLPLTLACFCCSVSWGGYGLCVGDLWTIIANGAGLGLAIVQLALYACYRTGAQAAEAAQGKVPPRGDEADSSTSPGCSTPRSDALAPVEGVEPGALLSEPAP